MKPLYMWAGGKNKMIPKYLETPGIPLSGYDTYVEPFFGGGAMMIYIYQNAPQVEQFVINDVNPEIVGIYRAIKSDVVNFKQRMDQLQSQWLPLSAAQRKTFYYQLRTQYTQEWQHWDSITESATLYFLMKTAFNGIWQTTKTSNGRFATPVGLCNQTDSVYDAHNVDQWHVFLQRAQIHCGDWSQCVEQVTGEKRFFFMDPPYIDSFTSYGQVFDHQEQIKVVDFCHSADSQGDLVFFCNRADGTDIWEQNQGNLDLYQYGVTYTAGRRATDAQGNRTAKQATEILLCSKQVALSTQGVFNEFFTV